MFAEEPADMADLSQFPRIQDMVPAAQRRMPPFAHAYMAAGTGAGEAMRRNQEALSSITLEPRFLRGRVTPDTGCQFLGKSYNRPFGVSPIGLQSLIWPRAERILAKACLDAQIPYCLSTVAGASIEEVTAVNNQTSWFQLYAPKDPAIMKDMLNRAKQQGIDTVILTADVPGPSRREDMQLAGAPIGSRNPMGLTPRVFLQCLLHPHWSLAALAAGGKFRFKNLEPYASASELRDITAFIGSQLNGSLTWEYLDQIRAEWSGKLLLKGVMNEQDVKAAISAGVDGLVLSNHGGRQLDAVPPTISLLPQIRQLVGDFPLAIDSGFRSGLDVARALALGADFVMMGRAFLFGLAAAGRPGADHVVSVLSDELENVMVQLGASDLAELKTMKADIASV